MAEHKFTRYFENASCPMSASRFVANIRRAVKDFAGRTNGTPPELITSDA